MLLVSFGVVGFFSFFGGVYIYFFCVWFGFVCDRGLM